MIPEIGCQQQPKQLSPEGTYEGLPMLEPCTPLKTYDYFSGSELSFAFTFLALCSCIPGNKVACSYSYLSFN